MKNILVLTDFSANAANAATNAVYLSEKLHTDLLLYYTYQSAPVTPYYAGGPFVPAANVVFEEKSNKELSLLSDYLKTKIEVSAHGHRPSIHHMTGEGNLGENVKEIIHQKNIDLVVMGARSSSVIDHLLSGSETTDVINYADRPVLIIPAGSELKHLKKIVFATNYNENDIQALGYLINLAQLFEAKIEVIHVDVMGERENHNIIVEVEFKKYINDLKYSGITYHDIQGKNVVNSINNFCHNCGADMLAMVHYNRSFFARIFGKSDTKKELINQKQAVLVFPPDFSIIP
jgi:nucleotide-binding universal stress UspA family protein